MKQVNNYYCLFFMVIRSIGHAEYICEIISRILVLETCFFELGNHEMGPFLFEIARSDRNFSNV